MCACGICLICIHCTGSALDLSTDGWVVRMWVRIPTATVVLMSLSKTLNHNCFSPPRSKWVPGEGRVGCCVWLAVYVPKWELRWFQEWFMCLMSRGNYVQRCDTSCKSAIKMPSLFSELNTLIADYVLQKSECNATARYSRRFWKSLLFCDLALGQHIACRLVPYGKASAKQQKC